MIKNFTPRLYQETIFNTASTKNTLVVLPTGMGKTNIFLMLAAHRLKLYPNSKILFIGPTKPLIDQYITVFKKHFDIEEEKLAVFTGMVKPAKRGELWKKSKIIFSTPQGLENDIISNRINLEEVSLLGIDEAHRAVGDYAYVFVSRQYYKKARYPRLVALTASPGSDLDKIKEVCENLFIEEIEIRTEESPDVKPYIQEVKMDWVKVDLPPILLDVQKLLKDFLKERFEKLKKWGILRQKDIKYVSKKDLLTIQAQLRGRASSGEKDFVVWNAISILAEVMKIYHGLELLETQGVVSLYKYLKKIQDDSVSSKVKAVKNIVKDIGFKSALFKTERLYEEKIEHPKLVELQRIIEKEIKEDPDVKILVFNQYRDNALDIEEKLNKIEGINAKIFVGQAKRGDTGYTQKEQKAVLDKFRVNEFNVLVATSVGEEGLDVPQVNLVIFFEPIPSAIRFIQRKGRTGRLEKGRVIILITKNTRDEAYSWSARSKQKRMYRNLVNIKRNIKLIKKEVSLEKFVPEEEKVRIIADYREKGSGVIRELVDLGINVMMEKIENCDYLLSNRCGVEFKTVRDFVDSIVDGRLLQQIKSLKNDFERPLVVIEGIEDIYSVRNVHANSIRGMLATIAVSYGIPVLYTKNSRETACLLSIIAKREQAETTKDFTMHAEKRIMTLKQWQEYIVAALPGIGATLAKPLLKKFKSIKKIVNAKQEKLEEVEKIGPKKAENIRRVLDSEYDN